MSDSSTAGNSSEDEESDDAAGDRSSSEEGRPLRNAHAALQAMLNRNQSDATEE